MADCTHTEHRQHPLMLSTVGLVERRTSGGVSWEHCPVESARALAAALRAADGRDWIPINYPVSEHIGRRVRRLFDGVTTEGVLRNIGAGSCWLGDTAGSVQVTFAGQWEVEASDGA